VTYAPTLLSMLLSTRKSLTLPLPPRRRRTDRRHQCAERIRPSPTWRHHTAHQDAYQKRMGWSFPWVSSCGSDFNYDYYVSFTPEQNAAGKAYYNYRARSTALADEVGIGVFYKNASGEIFHTYSCYSRGVDLYNGAYNYLDLVPKGRDEGGFKFTMEWLRRHDQYWRDAGVEGDELSRG
jgi:hypothetical protein